MKVNRILVPIDFSRPSLEALESALDLAEALGATVDVIHVVDVAKLVQVAGPPTRLETIRHAEHRVAQRRLDKLRRTVEPRRCEIRYALTAGAPHRMILDAARKLGIDMIVMATHGRSGLPRLLLGSVAEKVVRAAACPVLTIRPRPKIRRRGKTLRSIGAAVSQN